MLPSRLVHQPPLEHHHDAVGQLQQLVEIFADQQHGRAGVADGRDPAPDLGCRGNVQPGTGVLGYEHGHIA